MTVLTCVIHNTAYSRASGRGKGRGGGVRRRSHFTERGGRARDSPAGAGPQRRRSRAPPHPSRTDWTRLVPPPVLTGHVCRAVQRAELAGGGARAARGVEGGESTLSLDGAGRGDGADDAANEEARRERELIGLESDLSRRAPAPRSPPARPAHERRIGPAAGLSGGPAAGSGSRRSWRRGRRSWTRASARRPPPPLPTVAPTHVPTVHSLC